MERQYRKRPLAPGRRGFARIDEALSLFVREHQLDRPKGWTPAFQAWIDAAGKDLARRTRPVRFLRGELTIEVDSAAHMHELVNFTGETLKQRANGLLGSTEIRRVRFRLKS